MRYTVIRARDARDELTEMWLDATDQRDVSAAANAIDAQLAVDPVNRGVALIEGLRILSIPPLRVLFEVAELDRIVRVVRVRRV